MDSKMSMSMTEATNTRGSSSGGEGSSQEGQGVFNNSSEGPAEGSRSLAVKVPMIGQLDKMDNRSGRTSIRGKRNIGSHRHLAGWHQQEEEASSRRLLRLRCRDALLQQPAKVIVPICSSPGSLTELSAFHAPLFRSSSGFPSRMCLYVCMSVSCHWLVDC